MKPPRKHSERAARQKPPTERPRIRAVDEELTREEMRRGYWTVRPDGSWERTERFRHIGPDGNGGWIEWPLFISRSSP
jgi:hypothetical protein